MTNRTTVMALAALLQAGLAAVPPAAAAAAKAKKDCIYRREITTLRALDDKHVYVKAGSSRHYLVTMDGRCQGLGEARRLEVIEASSRVCPDGTSLMAFEHPGAGPMRCRIGTIEAVKGLADAEERAGAEIPTKK
jgi:uncharacterized protein DUF6491